jgi:hypothetical protein
MKNFFAASLAIAVAHAIDMQVDQSATCAANGDISLSRPPNQVIRIDSALRYTDTEWYDDDDCIPLSEDEAYRRGCWVGLWNGQQVPETLLGATRYNMWAQYRCPSDPENKGYWLNVARAERCLNAWADVEGDCSSAYFMRWSTMTEELKPFRMNQWDGDYSDPQMNEDAMRPCGLMQHSWEALGECEDNPYRFARQYQRVSEVSFNKPVFSNFDESLICPFYEFCWQDTWCSSE